MLNCQADLSKTDIINKFRKDDFEITIKLFVYIQGKLYD